VKRCILGDLDGFSRGHSYFRTQLCKSHTVVPTLAGGVGTIIRVLTFKCLKQRPLSIHSLREHYELYCWLLVGLSY
jgi:hypothetical protein